MPYRKERCKPSLYLLALFILAVVALSGTAAAKEAKTYPESGKVIGIGQNEHTKTHPKTGKDGNMGGGSYSVYSHTRSKRTQRSTRWIVARRQCFLAAQEKNVEETNRCKSAT